MEGTQDEYLDSKIPHLDVENAWKEARFLKQDLDSGEGWTQRYHVLNEYNSWSKTFAKEVVPVKLLYRFENLPMSAEKFIDIMSPKKLELRQKWDKTTTLEILEKLPNGGCICRSVLDLSFPFSSRDYVLYFSPPYETSDWFGRKAFAIFFLDVEHSSRPAEADGIVRATNGGNFYVAVPDDDEPGHKCDAFMLSTNKYNGWIPTKSESMVTKKASKVFYNLRQCVLNGHSEYFKN